MWSTGLQWAILSCPLQVCYLVHLNFDAVSVHTDAHTCTPCQLEPYPYQCTHIPKYLAVYLSMYNFYMWKRSQKSCWKKRKYPHPTPESAQWLIPGHSYFPSSELSTRSLIALCFVLRITHALKCVCHGKGFSYTPQPGNDKPGERNHAFCLIGNFVRLAVKCSWLNKRCIVRPLEVMSPPPSFLSL